MKILSSIVVVIMVPIALSAGPINGDGGGGRASGEKNVSWTLSDWLAQKQKFKLQDQWLAVNKQTNRTEFNLSGSHTSYDHEVAGSETSQELDRISAEFYLSIFGIEGGVEKDDDSGDATFGHINIRLLGASSQSTYLNAGYGARKSEIGSDSVTNPYAHVNLQLYIFDFFGVDGTYRSYFAEKANDTNKTEYEGTRTEYGAFVEFGFVRVFGRAYSHETDSKTSAGVRSSATDTGSELGVKLFF